MRLSRRHQAYVGLEGDSYVGGHLVTGLLAPRGTGELVYNAQTHDGRDVSIVVGSTPGGERQDRLRFRRLARLRVGAKHPGLLPVLGYGEHAGAPFVVTDPYPDRTLADLLEAGPIPPGRLLPILAPAAEALDACHALGLVHQNLTDESLLVSGEALVLDTFGVTSPSPQSAWADFINRDSRYATPEEMRGEHLGAAGNVYSLAALIVHALTGSPPYEGSEVSLTYAHLTEPAPRPSDRVPGLGHSIDRVIARGMDKNPDRRPQTATALLRAAAEALDVPLERLGGAGRSDAGAERRPRRRARAAAALIVIAAAAAGGFLAGWSADPFQDGATASASPVDAGVIVRLDRSRTDLRAELAAARLPPDQAAAATQLASSYREAAASASSPRVAAAASAAGDAYAELATAADEGSRASFAEAAQSVDVAEERFAAAANRAINLQQQRK